MYVVKQHYLKRVRKCYYVVNDSTSLKNQLLKPWYLFTKVLKNNNQNWL